MENTRLTEALAPKRDGGRTAAINFLLSLRTHPTHTHRHRVVNIYFLLNSSSLSLTSDAYARKNEEGVGATKTHCGQRTGDNTAAAVAFSFKKLRKEKFKSEKGKERVGWFCGGGGGGDPQMRRKRIVESIVSRGKSFVPSRSTEEEKEGKTVLNSGPLPRTEEKPRLFLEI